MTAGLIVRFARPEDAEALAELNRTSMGYDYPAEKTREILEHLLAGGRDAVFVAELNGRPVGYLHLADYDLLYWDHMKNIMGIAVDPSFRRMGIGSALLKAGEDWARESGASAVRLVSGESRTGAHAFYRSQGYEGDKMQINLKKQLY